MGEELNVNKITAEVITSLAKSASSFVVEKLVNKYKDITNKEMIDYGDAFEKYLIESEKNISMAKTILYGQTPHHLYTFFECMNIGNKKEIIDSFDVNNLLKNGHKFIITGTGGIGKSMLMRHFFLNTITNTEYIPVLIELRGLNEYTPDNLSLEDYIYKVLQVFGFKLEKEYFKYSLETGCYLFLLDGYDEVKNSNASKVTQEILEFSNKYSSNHVILSSRPLDEFVGWSDFDEYSTIPLNKEQALSLISKLEYDVELKNKFCEQLDKELYKKYESFASNPLLLTIMLMTFEDRLSIPDNRMDFYEQAFSTLFHRHDSTKKGKFVREKLSGLGYEDFRKVFAYFCFRSFFKSQYEFTEKSVLDNIKKCKEKICPYLNFQEIDYLEDMTKAVCVLIHEGLNYSFSHRSFQEYFAAVYTTQLTDEEQKQFITSWLKAVSNRMTTDFLYMLEELQPERFMKNILYDAICELYNMYESNGKSVEWFLTYMYDGISICGTSNDKKRTYVCVKKSYYHTVFVLMLKYLHYGYDDMDYNDSDNLIISKLEQRYGEELRNTVSFDDLIKNGMMDDVKILVRWIEARMNYVFSALDNIDINSFGKKRKFESMLDEL